MLWPGLFRVFLVACFMAGNAYGVRLLGAGCVRCITYLMGLNSHIAHFTTNPSDIPTARDQTELVRLFAVPLTHSVVLYDGYYAVKSTTMASLLSCYAASLSNASSNSNSNSSLMNDDDADDDDGGGEVSQTGSPSRAF